MRHQPVQGARDKVAVVVAKMHAIAVAVPEVFAGGALPSLHPVAVAVGNEAVLPYVHEVIFVDIALVEVGAYARA